MPNSSSIQSEQSLNTSTIQSTQTPASAPFTAFSCAQPSVNLQSRRNHSGVASLTFTDVQCDGSYLLDRRQAIIDALLQAAQSARALVVAGDYVPLKKPIEHFLSIVDLGVMVDAVALTDTDIQERANEIMARLSRECDLFVEYNGIDLIQALKPTPTITREKYAAFVFINEGLEYPIKTFIGHAATHEEAWRLARVAMENNPLAEGFVVERVEVDHE